MAIYYYRPYHGGDHWAVQGDKEGDPGAFLTKPLIGGPFDGYDSKKLATNKDAGGKDFKFFVFQTNTSYYLSLGILNKDGLHYYNIMDHKFQETCLTKTALSGDYPESSGSVYYGKTIADLFTLDRRSGGKDPIIEVNVRQWNATKGQVVIQDCQGFHFFNVSTGKHAAEGWRDLNVKMSGGPYNGKWFSDLCHYRTSDADTKTTFLRASVSSDYKDLQFMTPKGIAIYGLVSGAYDNTHDTKLTTPPFKDRTLSDLIVKGHVIDQTYEGYLAVSEDPLVNPARIDE